MEILGIGPMELVLILIIAMMVFGPDKLPEIGAKLGQSMKAMRKATREFSREIEGARQAVQAPVQELTQPFREIAQPVQQIGQDLKALAPLAQAVTNPQEALRQAVTGQLTAPPDAEPAGADGEPAGASASADAAPTAAGADEASVGTTGQPEATPAPDASQAQRASTHPHHIPRRKLDRTRRQRWQSESNAAATQISASADGVALSGTSPADSFEDPGSATSQADDGSRAAPDRPAQGEA